MAPPRKFGADGRAADLSYLGDSVCPVADIHELAISLNLREDLSNGSGLPERPCTWDVDLLLWCPPDHVPVIAGWWRQAAPQLEVLREPFTQHAAEPGGWITTFESLADFLTDWGEVVTEAERRGWGIVGLRC